MKRGNYPKTINNILLVVFTLTAVSCEQKKDHVIIAENHNTSKFNDTEKEKDAHSVVIAAEALLREIKLSRLAQHNSIRPDVRTTGKMLETEYTHFLDSLKKIAIEKTITIPTELSNPDKKTYNDLTYDIAGDFDKKYFELSESNHKMAIYHFEKIKNETKDDSIKKWVVSILPPLRKNLGIILIFRQNTKEAADTIRKLNPLKL